MLPCMPTLPDAGVPLSLPVDVLKVNQFGLPVMLKQASYFDIDNLDVYYEDCVVTGVGAFVIPIRERHQFVDATRTKLVREIAEMPASGPDALIQKAQAKAPRVSCVQGERQWRDRMGN